MVLIVCILQVMWHMNVMPVMVNIDALLIHGSSITLFSLVVSCSETNLVVLHNICTIQSTTYAFSVQGNM